MNLKNNKVVKTMICNKYFIYGTLLPGQRLYQQFSGDTLFTFHGYTYSKNFKMYDLGEYPCIVPTNNPNDIVYGVLFSFKNQIVSDTIDIIEEQSNYSKTLIYTNKGAAWSFIFEAEPYYGKLIPEGCWVRPFNKSRQSRSKWGL